MFALRTASTTFGNLIDDETRLSCLASHVPAVVPVVSDVDLRASCSSDPGQSGFDMVFTSQINVFNNIRVIPTFFNDLLQAEIVDAGWDVLQKSSTRIKAN